MMDLADDISQTQTYEAYFRNPEAMTLKIEALRCFCAVAKAGNLSDAADQLGRTQSAVSMTLKQLEAELGSPLFEGERKNRLTSLGQEVLKLGQTQLRQYDSMVQSITTLARAPTGILRVSSVPSMATICFPGLVDHMAQQHPSVRIELRDADTPQVIEDLDQGWADIGIASTDQAMNNVETKPLFRDGFGVVMSRDHPLARATTISIADLFQGGFLRNALCDQIQTPSFRSALQDIPILVHNTQSLLAIVQSPNWLTVLPHSALRLAPSDLVFRPVDGLEDQRQVFLYRRKSCPFPDLARDACEVIERQAQAGLGD